MDALIKGTEWTILGDKSSDSLQRRVFLSLELSRERTLGICSGSFCDIKQSISQHMCASNYQRNITQP